MRTSSGVALEQAARLRRASRTDRPLLVAAGWGLEVALDDGSAGVARAETACLAEGALEVSPVVISDRQDDVDDLDPGIGQPAC